MEIRYSATVDGPLALYADAAGCFTFDENGDAAEAIARRLSGQGAYVQVWEGGQLWLELGRPLEENEVDEGHDVHGLRLQIHQVAAAIMALAAQLRGWEDRTQVSVTSNSRDIFTQLFTFLQRWGRITRQRSDWHTMTDEEERDELRRALPTSAAEIALIFLLRGLLEPDDAKAQLEMLDAMHWIKRANEEKARYAAPERAAETEPGV